MNLEELKYYWQDQSAALEGKRLDREALRLLLEERSLITLGKINRNILLEMAVVALFGLFWLYYILHRPEGTNAWEIAGIFVYVLGSAVFYWYKYRSLNRQSLRNADLHTGLSRLVKVMKGYMRFYFWSGILLVPVMGTGGFVYGFYTGLMASGKSLANISPLKWLLIAGILLAFNLLAIWFVRLYIRWVYGTHYDALKACLTELEDEKA